MSLVVSPWSLIKTKNPFSQIRRLSLVLSANDELFRSGLAHFLLQALARITYTFILVRIGWTQAAHFGRDLSDFLAINPGHAQLGLLGIHGRFNAYGQWILDQMRITEAEHYRVLALHFGAIANADDFEVTSPSLGDAFNRVINQCARQAMDSGLGIVFAHR